VSNTLEWYAKRGLLAASDEPEEQNIRRLRLGRRIAKLAMATRRSGDLVASYAPRVGGGVRQRQLRWATDLASQSKKKLMEIQHDQLEASLSVAGGRDALVKRMRAGKF